MDLMLDIVVEPDLSWRWKDADEFDEILRSGIFDGDLGQRVRTTADRVIELIERRAPPFCEPWPDWRPDPGWRPALPPDWNQAHRASDAAHSPGSRPGPGGQ